MWWAVLTSSFLLLLRMDRRKQKAVRCKRERKRWINVKNFCVLHHTGALKIKGGIKAVRRICSHSWRFLCSFSFHFVASSGHSA